MSYFKALGLLVVAGLLSGCITPDWEYIGTQSVDLSYRSQTKIMNRTGFVNQSCKIRIYTKFYD